MTLKLPLHKHDGSLRDHALISDEDSDLLQYRWRMIGWGHVARNDRTDGKVKCVRLARQILGLNPGDPREADHINGNVLDNRRENLRIVTRGQNAQNLSSHTGSRSRYRGVDWFAPSGKWRARAQIAGKPYHVGYYATEEEAGVAAATFRAKHMPYAVDR